MPGFLQNNYTIFRKPGHQKVLMSGSSVDRHQGDLLLGGRRNQGFSNDRYGLNTHY